MRIKNLFFLCAFCLILGFSCTKKNINDVYFPTEKIQLLRDEKKSLESLNSWKKNNKIPFAGTVSHHLLAQNQIDLWFCLLKKQNPKIKTFVILSPSHWGLSSGDFSLTFGSWKTQFGTVETNSKIEEKIKNALNGRIEDNVFKVEHGVSAVLPFISKYFPDSNVCAVCYNGEPPVNQAKAKRLLDSLMPYKEKFFSGEFFLLVSSDFSHHGNLIETKRKDSMTKIFLDSPTKENWIYSICDNRPGIYVLANLLEENSYCNLLCHTNSFEISGQGAEDITSYFFTFFY